MKFAFIANIAGITPETYSAAFETEEAYNLIAGVDGMDAAKEYVKKLADEGYDLINLCGDFDEEITEELRSIAGEAVEIQHADYSAEELAKLEKLESFKNYGIIIIDNSIDEAHEELLQSEACDAKVIFVNSIDMAKEAGKKLVDEGADFIELCSWFDKEKMEEIVEATENKVPVGTCGEL